MKRLLSGLCCVALCSAAGLAVAEAPAGGAMSAQQFVDFAGQTDMVEANLGQMASSSASSQKVKDYGQMLVTDHTKDFNDLYTAAKQANVTRPDAIDTKHKSMMIDPMAKLNGAAFDKKFIHEMVMGHTQAVAAYKKEAADAQDPALKSYAQDALPVLQKHLDDAKALESGKSGMGGMSSM